MPDLRRLLLALLLCLPLATAAAEAPAAPGPAQRLAAQTDEAIAPRPFAARYRLEVKGWPGADVAHRLTREGDHWQSLMETGIRIAHGSERSRFRVEQNGVRALHYASGYTLLGVGDTYRLEADALTTLPDRQTALFALSRRALGGDCAAGETCRIRYLDHKGREEVLDFRILGPESLSLPAGTFEALTVEANEPDEPDRRLVFRFHPTLPGLLLAVDYHRDGERRSRLSLSELSLLE